jgi:CHAT domain-containing protein/tetratricopeptide (TPR) repeat protein
VVLLIRTILAILGISCLIAQSSRSCAQNVTDNIGRSERALEKAREAGDRRSEANELSSLGVLFKLIGKNKEAENRLSLALVIQDEIKDQLGKANTLCTLSQVYNLLGRSQESLGLLDQAIGIQKDLADLAGEANTYVILGETYSLLGLPQQSLLFTDQSLSINRKANDRRGEAISLNDLGEVYWALGQSEKAYGYYFRALQIEYETDLRTEEAVTLNDIVNYYWSTGRSSIALENYNHAIEIERALEDRSDEAVTEQSIGAAYASMGDLQQALKHYELALSIEGDSENPRYEAVTLQSIGEIYQDLGRADQALSHYENAITIARQVHDTTTEATTLSNAGTAYRDLGNLKAALDDFSAALMIQQRLGDERAQASTLHNTGAVFQEMGSPDKARDFYSRALKLERKVGDRSTEAYTLWRIASLPESETPESYLIALSVAKEVRDLNLQGLINNSMMLYFSSRGQTRIGIFFGKEAVNDYQQMRSHIGELGRELERSFIQMRADTYRTLAKLLVDEGRLAEGEVVIRMLKEHDYYEFIRNVRGPVGQGDTTVRLRSDERQMRTITAMELEWIKLQTEKPRNDAELSILEETINDENRQFLPRMQKILPRERERTAVMGEISGMQNILRSPSLRTPTVGIFTLVRDQELDIILVTKNLTVLRRAVRISRKSLNTKVANFRAVLQDRCSDPRPQARDLYSLLVGPIAKELRDTHAKTIVWELDGALGLMPVGALYDGNKYLAETYSTVLFGVNDQAALTAQVDLTHWTGLGMGVSRAVGHLDLPAVPKELEGIIADPAVGSSSHGAIPGKILLDDRFTSKALKSGLQSGFQIVHIASHFFLESSGAEMPYLLLGSPEPGVSEGEHLSISDLGGIGYSFSSVQLLTLSACETAVNSDPENGNEIEAVSRIAEVKGAKAVLATLWSVADTSTAEFMTDFYSSWAEIKKVGKVEAVRRAQVAMIERGVPDTSSYACPVSGEKPTWSHPYYWSPFVLVGNWQ